MKRFIFLFVFGIMSLVSFGQVDTVYYERCNGGLSYHVDANCSKLDKLVEKIAISDLTDMKRLTKHFRCYKCVDKEAFEFLKSAVIRNSINSNTASDIEALDYKYKNNDFYMSGKYLQKSANLQYAAVIMGALGGVTMTVPSMVNDMSDGGQKACFIGGGTLIFAGLITELCAINYKFKAGSSLKIAATKIQYNF